ncbi:MAG: DUF1553 domain-containing protein [Verrucomicrobiales bacterium]|nr:DUF1553 domain-containing protein [Verrucomicrobiales bacterium]
MRYCKGTAALLTLPIFGAGLLFADKPVDKRWAFQPFRDAELPSIKNTDWPKNRIDHFILAKMEAEGLKPSPPADSRVLARRLYFTLTGLPPTPESLSSAPSTLRDKLLVSPHYGEKWARHWLDLARYTDTTASWLNSTAGAWRYRDWVVKALNDDMPYPDFVKRQLATDLMAETGPEDNAALGFLGLSPAYWKELQLPPEIIKTTVADEWEERVDALGRTFLGLTLACARCHDHKADPITQADYYALAGVFASVKISDRPMMSEELYAPVKVARKKVAELEKKAADLKKKKPESWEADAKKLSDEIAAIKKATPHYDMAMANAVVEAALFVKPKDKGHGTKLDFHEGKARDLPIQKRGNPNDPGEIVPRRFLSIFPGENGQPRHFKKSSGRLELAESLIHDSQPLFARVIVNRIWKEHFGRGLVETPSDFGKMGERPSHPDLLDDLAARFIENGWSLKWLHREILGSATWQQTSVAPESEAADPDNALFSRMTRRRLSIEQWRDAMLQVSATLVPEIGGTDLDLNDAKNNRRTIYGKIHRRDLNKILQVHDFPDPAAHSPKRTETISPLQGLFALNGPLVEAQSKAFAKRIESAEDPIRQAYELLFQREPNEMERSAGGEFLKEATLAEYARVLLASNEFLFVD